MPPERRALSDEQRARVLASLLADDAPSHPIDPGDLGEYAALLRDTGPVVATRTYPAVADHLARGCRDCREDLDAMRDELPEPRRVPASASFDALYTWHRPTTGAQEADLTGLSLGFGDRFTLRGLRGYGPASAVYEAWDASLQRLVAVKVLAPGRASDPALVARFEGSTRLLVSLSDHPRAVDLIDKGHQDAYVYRVTRLLSTSLAERLAEANHQPADPSAAVALTLQVLDILDHAHQQGLVHGNVKPTNILLDGDTVFLTDPDTVHDPRTALAPVHAAYLAPEQLAGRRPGPSVDTYAVGRVLYELVTGRAPTSPDRLPSAWEVHRFLPEQLVKILDLALASESDARYSRAGALASALMGANS